MNLPHSTPDPSGTERAAAAKAYRDLATEISRLRPHALSRANGEENDVDPRDPQPHRFPANFTKGLLHDDLGLVAYGADYRAYVEAINSTDRHLFDTRVQGAAQRSSSSPFRCTVDGCPPPWRGWESPRSGHAFDLEGPDAAAVGMAPAPRVGSSELAAEMAEVYALALLRDVPFTTIRDGGDDQLIGMNAAASKAQRSAQDLVDDLNSMPFFSGAGRTSSAPGAVALDAFERGRRWSRTLSDSGALTPNSAFRGSTRGAHAGPYVSQFLLIGADSIAGAGNGMSNFPRRRAAFDLEDGFIAYGTQVIDQRTITHKNGLDHMTNWASWLDVQNGADVRGTDAYEPKRRFITTPRDLATYVHFDALYQAYLNAVLILLAAGTPASKGFPEPSPTGNRTPFATFGGPHVLSLVTEVATRCLKAVRRQKFNVHRRARPEALAGRLVLADNGAQGAMGASMGASFQALLAELPAPLLDAVRAHNAAQNSPSMASMRAVDCSGHSPPTEIANDGLLLPMAFPEGSPMHPAYGAGHATVAGGCVTMVKAFFEMYESADSRVERPLVTSSGAPIQYVPNATGGALVDDAATAGPLTIQGELDKLAANISIGRNMAGVHYYSDYYDSIRMGERVAVGILMEQAPSYGDAIEITFESFDGDFLVLSGDAGAAPTLSVMDRDGAPVSARDWWLRHVPGGEAPLDL
ncbi:MAG: bromoperoxidase [Planctomycetota bacterium]